MTLQQWREEYVKMAADERYIPFLLLSVNLQDGVQDDFVICSSFDNLEIDSEACMQIVHDFLDTIKTQHTQRHPNLQIGENDGE